MRTVKGIALFGAALLVAGCSIHPLPDDITRETTYAIVQKIRCEARGALTNISLKILRAAVADPRTRQLLDAVEENERDPKANGPQITDLFDPSQKYYGIVPRAAHDIFSKYALTTVGMDFSFDITETNDNQFDSNFRDPFPTGLFSLDAKGGMKLQREGKRQVQVADTFIELHDLLSPADCAGVAARHGNIIYPITGKIGVEEALQTFVSLEQNAGGVEKYTDTLTFTTTLTASANPRIDLNPISKHVFRLLNASLNSAANRTDAHSIVLTVKLGKQVTSLAQARQLAGISKQQVFRTLNDLRTENFFATLRTLQQQLSQ